MIRETRLRRLLDTAETHARGGRRNRAVSFYRKVLALTQDGEFGSSTLAAVTPLLATTFSGLSVAAITS